jgi:hypothetical protein
LQFAFREILQAFNARLKEATQGKDRKEKAGLDGFPSFLACKNAQESLLMCCTLKKRSVVCRVCRSPR